MIYLARLARATTVEKTGMIVFGLAWVMFLASFFLPASDVLEMPGTPPGTPMSGWQTMCSLRVLGNPFALLAEPRALLLLVFPLANLAMLLSPLLLPAAENIWPSAALAFLLAAAFPYFLPADLLGNRFIGYWLWQGSFFIMAAGWGLMGIAA